MFEIKHKPSKKKSPASLRDLRTEAGEEQVVSEWLDSIGAVHWHNGNENNQRNKRLGIKKGVPDHVIVWPFVHSDRTPSGKAHATAFEMKRPGGKPTREQCQWLVALDRIGWHTNWFDSSDDAIEWLKSLGYGR